MFFCYVCLKNTELLLKSKESRVPHCRSDDANYPLQVAESRRSCWNCCSLCSCSIWTSGSALPWTSGHTEMAMVQPFNWKWLFTELWFALMHMFLLFVWFSFQLCQIISRAYPDDLKLLLIELLDGCRSLIHGWINGWIRSLSLPWQPLDLSDTGSSRNTQQHRVAHILKLRWFLIYNIVITNINESDVLNPDLPLVISSFFVMLCVLATPVCNLENSLPRCWSIVDGSLTQDLWNGEKYLWLYWTCNRWHTDFISHPWVLVIRSASAGLFSWLTQHKDEGREK